MENAEEFDYFGYIARLRANLEERQYNRQEIDRCVQYARRLRGSGLPILFDRGHVDHVFRLNQIKPDEYHFFYLTQKDKLREITAPSRSLKVRQRWILKHILSKLDVSPCSHGFEKNRSILTNAQVHASHDYALCLDIEDFFPSIPQELVTGVFQKAGYSDSAAGSLSELCCYRGALPQGAPTSPRLANLIFKELDERLAAISAKYGAAYSRYADDLTFSADNAVYPMLEETANLLRQKGFQLNKDKVKFFGPGQPKRITGLIVQNNSVRVPKRYKRALKQEIYYCQKYGVLAHLENTKAERMINYREYLYGKAYYVHMVEPERGEWFLQELDKIQWPPYLWQDNSHSHT